MTHACLAARARHQGLVRCYTVDAHPHYLTELAGALLGELTTQNAGAFTDPGANDRETSGRSDPSILGVSGWSNAAMADLTWTYSNRLDLADLLRRTQRWVSKDRRGPAQDPRPGVRARSASGVPRRVVDRLGEDAVREMIEARRAGAKLRDLAERYGISESSVKRLAARATDPRMPVA